MLLHVYTLVLSVSLPRPPSPLFSVCGTSKVLFFKTQALSPEALSELLRQTEGDSSDHKPPMRVRPVSVSSWNSTIQHSIRHVEVIKV